MTLPEVGGLCFGIVIGWIVYRTMRRREGAAQMSDIATVIGAIGGAAVTLPFKDQNLFAAYAIGLAVGFFAYFLVSLVVVGGTNKVEQWMGK